MHRSQPIVLVSDQPSMTAAFARIYATRAVTVVGDSEGDAVALARRIRPDLIILELQHGPGAHEVLRELRAHSETVDIPVIVLARHDSLEAALISYELGAAEHVVKPLTPAFFEFVNRMLRLDEPALNAAA